jgi:CRP/FNR family cyclic AMP-dependent transcriptional regulator
MTVGEELLAHIPLFESLTEVELHALAGRLEEHVAEPGEIIFNQGDEGSRLYLIADGTVEITFGEATFKVTLARLFTGQYFGELSVFDRAPRSASAVATKRTHLMTLDGNDVVEFVNRNPAAALRIIAELSERLRQTNELMSRQVSRNVNEEAEEMLTFGQRVADRVAAFGGSWPFIGLFAVSMMFWIAINVVQLTQFDPYPFILLNLALGVVTALQAPVIMMSQNRQAMKDKLLAENDYRVNLKSETEIEALLRIQAEVLARLTHLERYLLRKNPAGE